MAQLLNKNQKNKTGKKTGPTPFVAIDISNLQVIPSANGSASVEKSGKIIFINSTDDLLWSVNLNFELITANNAFIKYLHNLAGITVKAGDNLLMQNVFPEDYLTYWKAIYKRALAGDGFKEEIYSTTLNNQVPIWTETIFNPIIEAGTIVGVACFSRNITERKLAEEKLKQSETRLVQTQEVSKVGSWETDLSTLEVIWSEETYNIFGLDPAKNTSHPKFLELVHPDDRTLVDTSFANSIDGNSINKIEHRIITPDGVIKIVEERWRIFRNNDGTPAKAVGTCQDITASKNAERDIKNSEEKRRLIMNAALDSIICIDFKGDITFWNPQAEVIFGWTEEEALGQTLAGLIMPKRYRHLHNEGMAHYIKTGTGPALNKLLELSAINRRGEEFPIELSIMPIKQGGEEFFCAFVRDITERKEAERLTKESEIKYRSFFESSMDGILLTVTDGEILSANPAACEIFGMTEAEICAAGRFGLVDLADPRLYELMKERQSTGRAKGEITLIRKNGSKFEAELTSAIFTDTHGLERTSMIIRDITERKQAEQRIKESNERYNLISKATNDMVWDWDLVTGKVYRNKEGWKKIFRIGNKEIENNTIDDWDSRIHPDDLEVVKQIEHEIQKSEKDFFEIECRVLRDDGTYAYIHDRGNVIRNEQGKAIRLIGATQDITARKEAELEVAKSEVRFRSLVQNSSDIICIFNDKGYFLYSSPAIRKVLGFEPDEIIEKNVFAFLHPDDIGPLRDYLLQTKADIHRVMPLLRFKNTQGQWRWIESRVTNMCDNPEVGGYVFNCRDVTEKKIAEAEIEKLSFIAKETTNAVIITNPEGEIVWVNEGFTKITEFELEEVMGKKPGDFLQGEETNLAVVRYMRKKLKQAVPFECDIINYSKSGRKYWLRIQCQPQFDESGNLKYFFAIETDITKEKEAEMILKASEERYRYLFNNNPACAIIWDIENFQILEVNDTAIELYGYQSEEFLSKTVFDLCLSDDYNKIKQLASTARQKKEFKSEFPCKHINKSGEEMHMHISSHLIQFNGSPVILAMAINITDKIILENELENERRLKQQEITNAVISAQEKERQELGRELHDNIIQILAGSRLYLGLAKKELNTEHPYLNETETLIFSAINEIRNLSHSLIAPLLHESELLDLIANIIHVTQESSGIMFSLQACGFDETDLPAKLKLSIYRIIQEQFNNIIKHAGAQKVIVKLDQEKEKTLLSIKDDGIGFDTQKKSIGVGLMNIKTRASLFNGDMSIISSPGNGCELRVLFN